MPPRRARHPPFFPEAGFFHGFAEKNFCSTPNAAISCGECGRKKHASNFPDVEEDVSSQITETKNFFCLGGRQGFSVTKLSAANFRRGEKRRRPLFFNLGVKKKMAKGFSSLFREDPFIL